MSSAPQPAVQTAPFDPFSPAFRADTEAWYPTILEQSPGFITMEGIPSAYVARYDQVMAVMRDYRAFSSVKPKGLPGMEKVDFFNGQPVMNYSDPPEHTRRRRIVGNAFSPMRMKAMAEAMEAIVDERLAAIAGRSEIEVVHDLTKPVSVKFMLGHLMHVPEADQEIFHRYVASLYLLDKVPPGGAKPPEFQRAWADGERYCAAAVAQSRAQPDDSLVSVLSAGEAEGKISDSEMMAMMVLLLTGGQSTLAHSATASLYQLARHPEVAAKVRAQPPLADNVMEESLRHAPPVTLVMRFCTQDTEVGGRIIPAGTPVYVMIAAACRDPRAFPNPYDFDLTRENIKFHLAFGTGIHTCIGNTVARLLTPLLIRRVLERYPKLRLADPAAALAYETTPRSRHIAALRLAV